MNKNKVDFDYRLEPLVEMSGSNKPRFSVMGYELLAGESSCPDYTLEEWRLFYKFLEKEVPKILDEKIEKIFINLDGSQMMDEVIFNSILSLSPLAKKTKRLVIEWTEQSFHDDVIVSVLSKIAKLKKAGFLIAVDDIGSGVDGMGRAHSCRPHFGKIDGQILMRERQADRDKQGLYIRGLVDSLRSQNTLVIVEFVENEIDREIVVRSGADFGQGFLWTKAEKQ